MNIKKLERLKEIIDEAKEKKTRAEGALAPLMERLKTEFKCATLEEAEKKIKTLGEKVTTLEDDFDEQLLELEKVVDGEGDA